jgi:hypothetical protein
LPKALRRADPAHSAVADQDATLGVAAGAARETPEPEPSVPGGRSRRDWR